MVLIALEITAAVATVVLALLWISDPGGNYEPWTVICGLMATVTELCRRFEARSEGIEARSRRRRLRAGSKSMALRALSQVCHVHSACTACRQPESRALGSHGAVRLYTRRRNDRPGRSTGVSRGLRSVSGPVQPDAEYR